MGGDIKVKSAVGKGTSFIITISVRITDLIMIDSVNDYYFTEQKKSINDFKTKLK